MADTEPDWSLLRTFREVARDGSLSAAARRLGLTQPTVGRHIDALEERLGVSLFARSPRGLVATQVALDMVSHAEEMASASAALLRAASGEAEAEHGVVRLTSSEFVGCEILPAILARFRSRHPTIAIELALSNRNQDLLRRDADIAVRMIRPTQKALIAKRIGTLEIGLYAHRSYVEANGLPQTVDDLPDHAWIGFDRDDRSFRSVGAAAHNITRDMFALRCDSDIAQVAMVRAGFGIGGCQSIVAEKDPDLVRVLPNELRFELETWLAMHEDLRATRRVRLLYDHLAMEFGRHLRDHNCSPSAVSD